MLARGILATAALVAAHVIVAAARAIVAASLDPLAGRSATLTPLVPGATFGRPRRALLGAGGSRILTNTLAARTITARAILAWAIVATTPAFLAPRPVLASRPLLGARATIPRSGDDGGTLFASPAPSTTAPLLAATACAASARTIIAAAAAPLATRTIAIATQLRFGRRTARTRHHPHFVRTGAQPEETA